MLIPGVTTPVIPVEAGGSYYPGLHNEMESQKSTVTKEDPSV